MKNFILSVLLTLGFIFPQDCEEPINVWFKISNDSKTYGQVIQLDMSKGYAGADGQYLYLYVADLTNNEGIVIMFPIGYWETEKVEKYIPKEEEEFDLDEYLKQNKGKGVKIAKQYNKVGE